MSKLEVSTLTISPSEKIKKIKDCLKEHLEGLNPISIARYTKINVNTVKSILPKMEGVEGIHGLYHLVEKDTHGQIFSWNFHNLNLTCPLDNYSGERINLSDNYEFIDYRFEVGAQTKKATLHVGSEYPLNMASLTFVALFFKHTIRTHTSIEVSDGDIIVSCVEFNKDTLDLRLEGVNCITLDSLLTHFKLYQKENCLRKEYKTKVPFKIENLFDMLNQGKNLVETETKIENIQQNLQKILKSQEIIGGSIQAFLAKKDKFFSGSKT